MDRMVQDGLHTTLYTQGGLWMAQDNGVAPHLAGVADLASTHETWTTPPAWLMESMQQLVPAAAEFAGIAADLASATGYFEVRGGVGTELQQCMQCASTFLVHTQQCSNSAGPSNAAEACATAQMALAVAAGAGLQAVAGIRPQAQPGPSPPSLMY